MTEAQIREKIHGAASFIDWFGRWPQFHDSEIIRCELQRSGESSVVVHTFDITSQTDANGHYVLDRHALVTFFLHGIETVEHQGFNSQNVLFGLNIDFDQEHFVLAFDPSYGLAGSITAKGLRLEWARGKPDEGVYA